MNSTYEFILKERPKMKKKNFWRTKKLKKIFRATKTKN